MITILTYTISTIIIAYLFGIIYAAIAPIVKDIIKAFLNGEIKELF